MNLGSTIQYGPVQTCHGGVLFPIDRPDPQNIDRLDHGALPLIARMHEAGIFLDKPALASLDRELAIEADRVLASIQARVSSEELKQVLTSPKTGKASTKTFFNPNSGDQVARLLYDLREHDRLALKPIRKTDSKSRLSTDDDSLSLIVRLDPVIQDILDYRGITKLRNTYTSVLDYWARAATSCVHTVFDVTTVVSGRLASRKPNLMNIPIRGRRTLIELLATAGKRIRNCFTVRPDWAKPPKFRGRKTKLISLDLSQIEMVTAAFIAGDPIMKKVFLDGADMHTFTALEAFSGMMTPEYRHSISTLGKKSPFWEDFKNSWRLFAKTVGFGILYGQEAEGLQQSIISNGGPLRMLEECAKWILDWFSLYSGVRDWVSTQHARARRFGMVWDLMGRHRWVTAAKSALSWVSGAGLRESGNTPIQSLAQGFLKLAMAAIDPIVSLFQGAGAYLEPLLQIHDELIFECEETAALDFANMCKAIMENVVQLDIPIKSEFALADTWGDLK